MAHASPFPLVPFAVWALAVLAYPACFLVALAGSGSVGLAAAALPELLVRGFLHLHIALLALAVWAIATGGGMAVLRRAGYDGLATSERAVFGGAIGMGILSLGTFLLGTVAGHPPWLLALLLAVLLVSLAALGLRDLLGALGEAAHALRGWNARGSLRTALVIAFGAGIILFALTRANVPIVADYDSLEYHLAAPAQWWRAGHIFFIRDVVYANFPQNTEMLYLLAMSCFGGPMRGAVVGLQVGIGFVVLAAAAIAACGRRLGSPAAGRAGAALFLATPMLAELGTLNSYVVELPMAAYSFLALYAFLLLRQAETPRRRWRHAVLCGVFTGLAIGCKYPAVVFVLAPVLAFIVAGGVLHLATFWRSAREAALVGAVAVAVASPWLVRNLANTGNPTYPLLYHTFGGTNWSPRQDAKFANAHRPPDTRLMQLGSRFFSYAIWRDQPGEPWKPPWRPPAAPLLILFALVPLALGDPRSARPILYLATAFLAAAALQRFLPDGRYTDVILAGGVLALVTCPAFLLGRGDAIFLPLASVLWLITWYALTHRVDRFLDPATPAVALLAGMGVAALPERWPRRVAEWLVVGGLAYAFLTALLIHAGPVWAGLSQPTGTFLEAVFQGSTYCQPAMQVINERLPADAKVLFVGESRTLYCRRRVLAATVFDRHPIERILSAGGHDEPARRVHDGLRTLGVTHIYVNWQEVRRLGGSYAYRFDGTLRDGFSDRDIPKPGEQPRDNPSHYITPQLFSDLLARGHLRVVAAFGAGPDRAVLPDFIIYELLAD